MNKKNTLILLLVLLFIVTGVFLYKKHMSSPTKTNLNSEMAPTVAQENKKDVIPSELQVRHNDILVKAIQGNQEVLDSFNDFAKRSIPALFPQTYAGYRVVSTENASIHALGEKLFTLETDVIFEKDGLYDWKRIQTIFDGEKIVQVRLGNIPYISRAEGTANNAAAEAIIQNAFQDTVQGNRQSFGVALRGNNREDKNITNLEVLSTTFVSGNGRELLYRVQYHLDVYGKKTKQGALVFLRLYEEKKWQIEDIAALGEVQ